MLREFYCPGCGTALAADVQLREDPIMDETRLAVERRLIDPITFEVIRHRLWAINDEQGRLAARLSGSTIVYEAYDLNAALMTADGRGLFCGVYVMHHGATIDAFVRLVLAEWPAGRDPRG